MVISDPVSTLTKIFIVSEQIMHQNTFLNKNFPRMEEKAEGAGKKMGLISLSP